MKRIVYSFKRWTNIVIKKVSLCRLQFIIKNVSYTCSSKESGLRLEKKKGTEKWRRETNRILFLKRWKNVDIKSRCSSLPWNYANGKHYCEWQETVGHFYFKSQPGIKSGAGIRSHLLNCDLEGWKTGMASRLDDGVAMPKCPRGAPASAGNISMSVRLRLSTRNRCGDGS